MSPVCRCGNKTVKTEAHCDDCKKKEVELKKALDEKRQMTVHLFDSCFRGYD